MKICIWYHKFYSLWIIAVLRWSWVTGSANKSESDLYKGYIAFLCSQDLDWNRDYFLDQIEGKAVVAFEEKITSLHEKLSSSSPLGQPYNQLAILASSKGDHLTTIFYYCRSIAVKFPFPAASTNLQKALSKALERWGWSILGSE